MNTGRNYCWDRDREREREIKRKIERKKEREHMCVCEIERKRENAGYSIVLVIYAANYETRDPKTGQT